MTNNSKSFILLLFILFNFTYFLIGFIFQHDFSNGGKIDFDHIYNNFILFKNSSILEINWRRYESTSLPLHYLITKYIIPENNIFLFKLYTFLLSVICVFLFYKVLALKTLTKKFNINLLALSSIILLSSSFRTDGFFGLEENIGFFCFLLGLIFFYYYQNEKNFKFKFLTIFFSCLVFYSRQTYAFVPIITYFYFLDKKKLISKKNFLLSFLYFLFLSPSLFFFLSWGSPLPTLADSRLVPFQLHSIPMTFAMYIIFTFPFYLLNIKNFFSYLSLKNLIIILFFFILYCILFWNIEVSNFGGGPLAKFFLFDERLKIIYLFFSFLGFLTVLDLAKNNLKFFIFFLFFVFIYFYADKAFFSYLDPLLFIIILSFSDKIILKIQNNYSNIFFLIVYFCTLHLSWIFYFKVYLGGVIR